jgi:hypothetical protein
MRPSGASISSSITAAAPQRKNSTGTRGARRDRCLTLSGASNASSKGARSLSGRLVRRPQSECLTSFRRHGQWIVGRRLGAVQFRVDCGLVPVDDGLDDAVLAVQLLIGLIEGPLGIG